MEHFFDWMRMNWGWILSFGTFLIAAFSYLYAQVHALKCGVQALLRAQMIDYYNQYIQKGYAPLYARQSFENCWVQYERLGKNGVMRDIRAKFLALPTHEEEDD